MIAPAGSALWLLKHEVRLFMINVGFRSRKGEAKSRPAKVSIAIWVTAALAMHILAYFVLRGSPNPVAALPHPIVMAVTGMTVAALTLMLSTGLKLSVEVLFERGDLDLLLSSPLSSHSIFTVRLAGITVGIASLYLFFLTPFAHVGLALGQFRWLGIYPSIIGLAALTASAAMLMTLGLVRVLGVRRTRVVAQILGALSGALFFLISQLYSAALRDLTDQAAAWFKPLFAPGAAFGPDSALWLVGRAVLGAPLPLLLLSLAALAVFLLTVRFTHRFFVHGVQQAVGMARAAKRPAGALRFHFGRSLVRTVIVKEWRLIARDPQLISQVLLQLLYLLPICVLIFAKGSPSLPRTGAALCFLCGSLAGSLAWVIISAEDAPDLLLAAPCNQGTIRRAKLAAVALPPLLLIALPLFWIALRNPLSAALMGGTVAASVSSTALIILWLGRPAARSNFKIRAKGNFLCNTAEFLSGLAWAGISYLLLNYT